MVLNVGIGTDKDKEGGLYADYVSSDSYIGLDKEPNPAANGAVIQGHAEAMGLQSDQVDLVLVIWAFQYMLEIVALQEILRVLKPGGEVIIGWSTPDDAQYRRLLHCVTGKVQAYGRFDLVYEDKIYQPHGWKIGTMIHGREPR